MAVPKDAPAPKSSQKVVKEESLSQIPQIPPTSGQMLPPSIPTGDGKNSFDTGPMILPHSAPIPKILVAASQPVPHSSLPQPSQDQGLQSRHRNLDDDEEDGDETESDPDQELEDHELPAFDWNGLAKRYDTAMQQAEKNEDDLGVEFKMLANYFATWSSVSHLRDSERAAKRYKTREAHIRHSEVQFKQKKEHYNKVVSVFQNAMELLRNV